MVAEKEMLKSMQAFRKSHRFSLTWPISQVIKKSCHPVFPKCGELCISYIIIRRVWRYQRGNQNLSIEEEQTTQWPKEKVPKDKQSTKHTLKTKDWVTRTPQKTGG